MYPEQRNRALIWQKDYNREKIHHRGKINGGKNMQFLIKAYDGPNMLEKRMAVRPRHLEGMKALGRQIIVAGGLLDESGKMKGSALVMDFPDRAVLDEYLNNEPYVVEGVWQKIEVEIMNVVLVNGEKVQ